MMPARHSLTSSLALLLLLGTVRAGPFSSRSNITLRAPRPPPKPGGRTAEPRGANPTSQLYEHTVEGGEKQVVFTHRINLPPSTSCGCPPGTEPPVPASEVQALRVRLEILEELVKGLKEQCTGGCCPAAAQAGTGQTDVRSLCSLHGVFDLSRCACSCEPGWGGPSCSDPTDAGVSPSSSPSAPGSCPDDCNDQGRCVRGRCVCFPGYTGPSCGWPSCPGDCHGHGRCVQGVCVCRLGFSGDDCSLRSCPRGCSQRGRCENGRCVCNPGYTGEDCAVKSCPRGCSQKGRCEEGRCVCDPGYTGEDCSSRTCAWNCGEGGRCVDGRCLCWPGYAGEDCSTRTCPRNCRGRGHCEDGECICDTGYSGDDCGVRSCPSDCNQRGHCEDGRCMCWPGYTGPDCSGRACPRDCRGRGRCENGVCVCNTGYSGEDCGVRSCPGDCRGRGRCESGRCVCWPGYIGRDCGTRACPGDCRGRGRCVDGRCVCNPGFTGEDCGSRRCPGDCRGRGHCEDGVCTCDTGYEGEDCSLLSCPGGCRGHGQCLDGRCICDDDYSGDDCGVRRCPADCSQRGVCQDGVCNCWEGYAGEDCSLRTCPSNCHQHGHCDDGRCVCYAGYTGPSCSTRTCPANCQGRGHCVQGSCVCHAGYSGEDCGQEEPPASACPEGCGPRELCRAGQCVCVEGFRGPDCAIQTCPEDCRGRGECREGRCICQEGYAGEDCGEEVPAIEGMRMHLLEETTVRTEWTRAPGPVDAYEIQFTPTTDGASPPFTARVPNSASAYDQRGLAPGQEYQVTVRALRGTNWGPPVSKTITTMIDGPQDLRVVAVTPTTLELSWLRPQAEVDRFVVSYVTAGNERVRLEVPAEADGTLLTDLMPGVEYVVTVTAERGRAVSYPASVRANTGSSPSGLLGATDEPPPSGPSTTQGVQAPALQQRPQELGELRVLGKDKTGHLHVAWTAQPDTFAHFQLRLWVPDAPGAHEELLPGDVRQALVPSPPPGAPYVLSLHGVPPEGKPSAPLIYQGIMDRDGEKPGKPLAPPRLGELTVTDVTSSSLLLHWTVPEGEFDSFMIQYKDRDGPHMVPAEGPQRSALITNLDPGLPQSDPSLVTPPRLGTLWVTDPTPDSLHLSWTVPEGQFDSFVVQYRDRDGRTQVVPVEGPERSVTVSPLDPDHKYRFTLFGIANRKRHGPLTADGSTAPQLDEDETPSVTEPSTEAPATPKEPFLGQLTVTGSSPDSLRLSWTIRGGQFDHFLVQYKNGDGQPKAVRVPGHEDGVTISGLEPDHKYKMNLYGFHNGQRQGPISAIGVTAAEEETPSPTEASTEAPAPPEEPLLGELTVTDSSPDSLSLSWTLPQGRFDSFTIQYKDRDGRPQVVRVGGEESEVTVRGLEPGRKYKMHLYGLHGGQRVGPVSTVGLTAAEAPESPKGPRLGVLAVTDRTPDSLRLSWTVNQGSFDSFVVQYRDTDSQSQALLVGGDQNKVLVSGLEPSTPYKFFLYGLHEGKRLGPISAEGTTGSAPAGQTLGEPGPRLSQLSVSDVTTSSLRLNWEAPSGAFDSFLLRYGVPLASTLEPHPRPLLQREVTVPGTRRSAVLRDLRPGSVYSLTLYGLRGPHNADSVQGTARTLSPVLESPRDLQFSEIGETSARVSWMPPPSRVDSFKVSYQLAEGGEPQSVQVDSQARTQQLEGLAPGAHYEVTVVSVRGFEESEPLTGFLTTVPDGPTQLRALNLTEGTAMLHWKPPQAPVDTYDIWVTAPGTPSLQASAPGSTVDYPLHGLALHTNYTATVHGLRGPNLTSPASITFTTGLEGPRDLEAKEVTPRTALLSWTEPQVPPTGYLLTYDTPGGQTQEILLPGGLTSHQLLGLFPSTSYRAWLRAVWGESLTPPMSTSFTTGGLRVPFPRDCGEEMQNGAGTSRTSTIFLNGNRERPLNVFCDMETDGGGWLVFQRRMDGHTDFWRDWEDYARGFGNITGEFWLGNEVLHSLTRAGDYSMRVDLRAGNEAVFAQYDSFRVDSASEYYRLHLEGYHGTAGDSMSYHSGSVFSARDRDPNNLLISCAVSYRGAWWYRNCHYANLNGLYGSTVDHQGVSWYHWKGFEFSVPFTEMKLRPRGYRAPAWGG